VFGTAENVLTRTVQYLMTAESKALYLGVQCHFLNYGRCVGTVLLMFFK